MCSPEDSSSSSSQESATWAFGGGFDLLEDFWFAEDEELGLEERDRLLRDDESSISLLNEDIRT